MSHAFAPPLPARPFVLRTCGAFAGLAALAVLIWIAGPLVALGDWRPLESGVTRALLIGVLFAGWGARAGWRRWRAARLNAQLLNQLQASAPLPGNAEAEPAHLAELRHRFGEAAAQLKTMRLAPGDDRRSGFSGWIAGLSRRYLYQLPWYVFIGAPGSGKTTALVNSGLSFPLAEQFGKAAIRGVGGTRHCDWWFTNEAVLIDTAGRYTTHESNRALDEDEWRGFVGLLRKYRPQQPLNGALLTISVADLLGASDAQRTGHAMALRKRLQELRSQLGIQFPVYVLVTKADLLAGFSEYFGALGRAERAQVWGFTFGLDESRAPGFDLRGAFNREYDLLHRRLNDALPELLGAESDVRRHELIYSLPQQFALLRDVLAQLVEEVFSQSRFGSLPMLRGVYLTSGTQEGTVFDRVMGGIKRFLQIDGTPPAMQTGTNGRSFFLKDLLQGLIVSETTLAGTNLAWHRRRHVLMLAGYATAAVLLCMALALWMRSYVNNSGYLDDVSARVATLDQQLRRAPLTDATGIGQVLPVLDDLRHLARTGRVDPQSPPLAYRWGLFQGDKTRAAANGVYQRALDELLLPLAARRLEATLQSARSDDPTFAYAALKAYLMLYDSAHYDPPFVQAVLALEFERTLPHPLTAAQRSALATHLAALFADRMVLSPFAMNEQLVAQTRARLQQLTFAQRLYAQLTHTLRGATQSYDFDVAHAAGPSAALVFRRQSGKSLNDALPGLYTYRGYWDVFDKRLDESIGTFAGEEKWVLNLKESDVPNRAAAESWARDIRTLYLDDYMRVWDAYLNDIRLQTGDSGDSLAQSIQAARVLSSPDSPLTRLIDAAAAQTALIRSDASTGGAGFADRAQDKVESARHALAVIFSAGQANGAAAQSDRPEAVVDNHFAGLRQYAHVEGRSGNAPIDGMLKLIDELYTYLSATDAALRSGGMPPPSDVPDKVRAQAGRMPAPFRQMLGDLADGANGSVATLAQRNLARGASADVGDFCRQAIAGRYPFAHGSSRDVALGDFAQLFAPSGLMDDFFRKNLQAQVDTATRPWRFNAASASTNATATADGIAAGNAAPFLASFEKAAVIRDVFFAGGSRDPAVKVQIKPLDMDPSISEWALDAGGQSVHYAHGPQAPVTLQWPAPGGGNQARLQVIEQSGATDGWVADGPWALYRLFDHARIERGRSPEELIASFAVDGKQFKVQITADSVHNPFRLAQMESFTCPGKS
ncbi:putative lipoprotein [Paraburkholderia piptadeniae]|uniref:Lipoprotein n=1 Tax=Paraburkholderia piptadeniae TaxID=1701573 RepID=A0A1N7SUN3_9BURK|nr:type VI secretion system membrane subunit TssM [Paraburkholderia piptadeniae]SIT51118.1 putative lipoprotein [Paraburkholderia piptadeniae]